MSLPIQAKFPKEFFEREVRCGYEVIPKLKKIWAVELDLFLEFSRVCRKHNIDFHVCFGTLLGAVRHYGFYEEWDDVASKYAIALDCELRLVAKAKGADLAPCLTYWESTDEKSLTRKIKSVRALKGIGSPITADGLLDFSSRYIQSDVKFALQMVRDLARNENIETPVMDEVIAAFCGKKEKQPC